MIYKQIWFGQDKPCDVDGYRACIDQAEKNIKFWNDQYMLVLIGGDARGKEAAIKKDIWVFEQLIAGDCVVFDCDLIPLMQFPFDKPGAYMIYEFGSPRIGMAASIGEEGRQWWTNRWNNKIERGIPDCYGFPNKLFRPEWLIQDGMPIVIPAEYYEHKRLMKEVK